MSNAIKSGAVEESIYQIETNSIQWTTNGNIDLSSATERLGGGSVIGKRLIQQKAIQKALELLGDQAWECGYKSKTRHNARPLKSILPEVQEHCGYALLTNKLLRIQWTNFNQTKATGCLRNVIIRGTDTRNKPNCCV